MEKNQFSHFNFKPFLNEAIEGLNFKKPTEIQERLMPSILKKESAIGQSQTGTGKTHAFLLPILNDIDPLQEAVQAVITAPTRELATQIYHEILKIIKFCQAEEQITAKCLVGGTDKQRTIDKLKTQPQIVVGTPGRINDLINEKALMVYTAGTIVIDEADLMLDMGFIQDVDQIAARMAEKLQILVFSATIPERLKPFLQKYMENPKYTHVAPNQMAASKIEHYLVPLRNRDKMQLLHDLLVLYNPYFAIVFTNTKKMADEVADGLLAKGLKVGRLHGDLIPRERKKVMKQINDLEYQFIVATDLAARGIDIKGVSHIINFELPIDLDFYIHRVGRTARAGHSGVAATIYKTSDENALIKLEKMGVSFTQVDIKNNDWVKLEDRNKRKNRQRQETNVEATAKKRVKKPKLVKPGYKKKMKIEVEKVKKRERRITKRK
jgi:ATP-dependent RNA helicase CshB